MDKNLANAYSEVLDILNYIEPQYKCKIPKDMLDMFNSECNKDYLKILLEDETDRLEKDYYYCIFKFKILVWNQRRKEIL